MAGISTGTGLFSGINTQQLIDQLIQAESTPKVLAQRRVVQLQAQQAAYLDLNTRLASLKTAAAKFGTAKLFQAVAATSSAESVLRATASAGASPGTYQFIVDRVVSTQQSLSRGFADRNTSAIGATTLTFEGVQGRLDRDTSLADLNGGQGISRGKVVVTDSAGAAVTVDLSRVGTVSEVLDALNEAGAGKFTASVQGDKFVLTDAAGGAGRLTVANAAGFTTATSLGIAGQAATTGSGGALTGTRVYSLGLNTSLRSLNDGNGIRISTVAGTSSSDFTIQARDGTTHSIDIGDMYDTNSVRTATAVSTLGGLIERINTQTAGKVTASIAADGASIVLTDTTGGTGNLRVTDLATSGAATDLGLVADVAAATITSKRLLAGMNSTLAGNLNGGSGLAAGDLLITDRGGTVHSITVPTGGSVSDILEAINTGTAGRVTASLDPTGTGLQLTDTTNSTGNLIVSGAGATALGLTTTGVAASTLKGTRLQHRYIAESTLLSTLNGGTGIGTGTFEITSSTGARATVNVTADTRTIGDVIGQINGANAGVRARINANGDGILLEETSVPPGTLKIKVADTTGTVAKSLNLVGEASGTGASNFINGSFERTVAVTATDTLDAVVTKINNAGFPVTATVINDGTGGNSFRLSLSSRLSGQAGRFSVDSGTLDLGLATLSRGTDARLFYGSDDPARAVLLSSTTNIFDNVVGGLKIDAVSASQTPVSISVSRDNEEITKGINDFITAFNDLVGKISTNTSYDSETKKKGTLLGDSTVESLRLRLFSTLQSKAQGVSGQFQYLSQVGIKITTGGKLQLDEDALRAALDQDPQGVADLFAAKVPTPPPAQQPGQPVPEPVAPEDQTYLQLGVAEQLVRLADEYVNSVTGVFKSKQDAFNTQAKLQNDRIADIDKRLASKRTVLERQFLAMEQAIGAMQSQQSALAGLSSLAR